LFFLEEQQDLNKDLEDYDEVFLLFFIIQ